ncbi:MAG TPA: potassium transporter, partial [Gammaproteobacteria bacterium]|nr:potassium transporter [Gammaproteobacteria bacterium]
MLPPMMVGLWYGDGGVVPFLCGFAVTFSVGLIIWAMLFRRKRRELRAKDGFFIVSMFWTVLAFFGAVPLYLFQEPSISFTDSFFEAVSGL